MQHTRNRDDKGSKPEIDIFKSRASEIKMGKHTKTIYRKSNTPEIKVVKETN